jgi:D-tyrosyl-tRNA(Tyr) deacylase
MKLVIQRVTNASVSVNGEVVGKIGLGLCVLVGIKTGDTQKKADFLAMKLSKLRVMSDAAGKMNLSIKDVAGAVLVVSQFTLYGDTRGGNRPSFITAAPPEVSEPLYEYFVAQVKSLGMNVATGKFGADMQIAADIDGPVTIILEE